MEKASASPESQKVLKDQWLSRLSDLVDLVDRWAQQWGWSTRRIEKKLRDSEIDPYEAPALLMQFETARVLLEPITRSAPGAEGVVDLYLMPAYDDIATLVFQDGAWYMHYALSDASVATGDAERDRVPFSEEVLKGVLEKMKSNAGGHLCTFLARLPPAW